MVKINDKSFKRYLRSNLFSEDFLENHLEDLDEYKNLDEGFLKEKFKEISSRYKPTLKELLEPQLELEYLQPIFKSLGHVIEVQTSKKSEETDEGTKKIDYAFFHSEEDKETFHKNSNQKNAIKYSSCATICEAKRWGLLDNHDKALKNDNTDPIWQIKKSYLDQINPKEQKATVPFGILTDGKSWRIYSYRAEMDKFFELNLEEIIKNKDFDRFKTFWFFFSKDAFRGKSYLSIVESGSKKLQSQVSDELRKQVYLSLELIATGLFRVYNSGKREWDDFKKYPEIQTFLEAKSLDEINIENPETEKLVLDIIYSESLVYLFRVLFLLYADHRNLFKHRKVETVFYNLLNKIDSYSQIGSIPDSAEDIRDKNDDYDINGVFEEIDKEFNGGLFSRKLHSILNNFDIDNVLYANAIDYLTRTFDKKTQKAVRVDFSVLEVRHLGTIYEGLLEYKLKSTKEETIVPLLSDKKKTRKLLKGDLYLVNDKGERKASGSYYTPDYIVESIVKYTVGPLIDEIVKKESGPSDKIKEILLLRILDPAMGSAHFLVEVISYINGRIEDLIQEAIEEITRKSNRRSKTLQDLENLLKGAEEGKYKRMIAKRCIYGVDKNAMAVELAKLSIWIFTLQKNQKLEFFDYNLRCGDSLIGSQEKTFSGRIDSNTKEMMLFANNEDLYKNVIENFKEEFKKYFEFENVDEKKKYFETVIKPNQQKLRYLANIELALAFADKNDEIHSIYSSQKNKLLQIIRLDQKNEYIEKLSKGKDVEDWELKLFRAAKKIEDNYNPIHWELDFPNVFIERGGFDAVVGNPPYIPTENLDDDSKIYFEKSYKSAFGRINIFPIFYEKAILSSNKTGYIGYVTPYTILKNQYFINSRKFILDNTTIVSIIDFQGTKVFADAIVDSVILILSKNKTISKETKYIHTIKDFSNELYSIDIISENKFEDNIDYALSISSENSLIERITKNAVQLNSIVDFNQGVITGNNKEFITDKKELPNTVKVLTGSDFNRYNLNWNQQFLIYDKEKLHRARKKEIFENSEKILLRQTGSYPIVTVDFEKYYTIDTIHNGIIINNNFSIKYIIALLNSKLIRYVYEKQINETGKVFAQVKIIYVNTLPIPEISIEKQAPFIRLADIMLSKNKELQEIQKDFNTLLVSELLSLNPTLKEGSKGKLEDWYLLDWSEFSNELKKKKIVFEEDIEVKWLKRFDRMKKEALAIKAVIDSTDKEIDILVYRLYDLTFDEVKIVDPEFGLSKKDYEGHNKGIEQ